MYRTDLGVVVALMKEVRREQSCNSRSERWVGRS